MYEDQQVTTIFQINFICNHEGHINRHIYGFNMIDSSYFVRLCNLEAYNKIPQFCSLHILYFLEFLFFFFYRYMPMAYYCHLLVKISEFWKSSYNVLIWRLTNIQNTSSSFFSGQYNSLFTVIHYDKSFLYISHTWTSRKGKIKLLNQFLLDQKLT